MFIQFDSFLKNIILLDVLRVENLGVIHPNMWLLKVGWTGILMVFRNEGWSICEIFVFCCIRCLDFSKMIIFKFLMQLIDLLNHGVKILWANWKSYEKILGYNQSNILCANKKFWTKIGLSLTSSRRNNLRAIFAQLFKIGIKSKYNNNKPSIIP